MLRLHRSPSLTLTFALLGASALALGCQAESHAKPSQAVVDTPSDAAAGEHRCTVTIAERSGAGVVSGIASGDDEGAVLDAALADACAQLSDAERPYCRDEGRFEVTISGSSSELNGVKTFTKTVRLTPTKKPQVFTGEGSSEASSAAACGAAILVACEAAGATGDCVAAGTHDKRSEGISSVNTSVTQPSS